MRYRIFNLLSLTLAAVLVGCGQVPMEPKIASQASAMPALITSTQIPTAAAQVPTTVVTSAPTPSVVPTATVPAATPTVPPAATAPAAAAAVTPTAATQQKTITITSPKAMETVSSPLPIGGSANYWPFEATLVVEIKDASGNVLGRMPVMVQAPDIGQGGPWSDRLTFTAPEEPQEGTLEVFETSMKDGSITTISSVKVQLAADPGTTSSGLSVQEPAAGSNATLPLHVAFAGGRGDEQFDLRLTLADGTELKQTAQASLGYVATSITGASVPGPAELEIVRTDGTVVEQRQLTIVPPEATQTVKVAWIRAGTEDIVLEERSVPSSPQIGSSALNELLWGPTDFSAYATSFPSTAEIMTYSGRDDTWGARVQLLKLTITDGIATANFSPELQAYGGGSARAAMIRKQIESTLLQFPTVQQVIIAVDGQTEGVLQP